MLWKLSLGKSLMCTLLKRKLNTLNNIVTILTKTNPHAYPRPRKPPSVFWTPPHNVDRIDSCYYEYSKVTNFRNLTLLNHSTFILGDQLVITGYYVIRVIMSVLSEGHILAPLPPKIVVLADQASSAPLAMPLACEVGARLFYIIWGKS